MKLLYGTGNPAKLDAMKSRLENLNIELIGLNDLIAEGMTIPKVPEDGILRRIGETVRKPYGKV